MSWAAKIHRRDLEYQVELGRKCIKLKKQGVTVADLCARFGVSPVTIGKWKEKAARFQRVRKSQVSSSQKVN